MVKKRKKSKPVIGICCEVHKLRPYFSEFELTCDYRYVRAILRAGGVPLLLPIIHQRAILRKMMASIDGLLMIGGEDIHPAFYGERKRYRIKPIYRGRMRFETAAYRMARRRKIPILAICYGMQLINVMNGGTLYQDIERQIRGAQSHSSKRKPFHTVWLKKGCRLAKILKKREFMVYSIHHQAIKQLGHSLQAVGYSPDTVIEAIEGPPQVYAVQWHPERQERDEVQKRLFRSFINLCRRIS